MLNESECHTTIPVLDIKRARKFYSEKLGLIPMFESAELSAYQCSSTWFNLYLTDDVEIGDRTRMAWQVKDFEKAVSELKSRGVVFENMGTMGVQNVDNTADIGSFQSAWFRDSEGNMLGIHSDPEA